MKKSNRKGFTIVELVIVIAVIAILAAVLIPTFSNLIKKANMSADQQAVRQMNTLLAAEEATGKPETFANAINALLASDVSAKNYKALTTGMSFYWVREINRVVYVDSTMKVVYPKEYEELTYKMEDGWFSLSGEVATDDKWEEKISNNTLTVADGSTLVAFMNAVVANDTASTAVTTISITQDIDLKGAEANFGKVVDGNFTITGVVGENGKVPAIYNLRNGASTTVSSSNINKIPTTYGYGLFGIIQGNSTVTIENVEFVGVAINATPATGAEATSGAGVIAGVLYHGSTLTLNNVTIRDSYVNVAKKAGAVVGYVESGSTFKANGLTINNVQAAAGKQSAAVLGYVQTGFYNYGATTLNVSNLTVTNVTVTKDASYGITDGDVYETNSHYWYVPYGGTIEGKNFN